MNKMTIANRLSMTTVDYLNTREYLGAQQRAWELGFSLTYNLTFRVNYNSGGTEHTAVYVKSLAAAFKNMKQMTESSRFDKVWRKYT